MSQIRSGPNLDGTMYNGNKGTGVDILSLVLSQRVYNNIIILILL